MAAAQHQEIVAELRKRIKAAAPGVSVRMSRGSAWGNVHMNGSGEFGRYTTAESAALDKLGLDRVERQILMYPEVEYLLKRINGTVTPYDTEAARRRDAYSRCD